ncbi:MAG TPA: GNAT family N-acetyltransferase [Anaerolineales bacterium]|nr:GNAT family N-acetyltransferase [Anaerolineales bacterium]
MAEIQVRPAIESDLPYLTAIDHRYRTEYVWQLDVDMSPTQIDVAFRRTRLPRATRQDYPRDPETLKKNWRKRTGLLVAVHENKPLGYISLEHSIIPATAQATDLAVSVPWRRKGIGTALILAAQDWTEHHHCRQLFLEMQSKNYPAITLAMKLGYEYCGYSDRYYLNQDIALFFSKSLR